jgi:class 3 adenylate cyclase
MPFPHIPSLSNLFDRLPRFGSQLNNCRSLRGVTIEQLAASVNLAPSALRDIEAGKRPAPPKEIVLAICSALNLDKQERSDLLEAAELDSPVVHALTGRQPERGAHPPLTAAILVFLIADVRGYTAFTQEHGDAAAAALTGHFAEMAHAACEQWDGHLVEVRGDEVLTVFASARQAVRAAQDLQSRYADAARLQPDWPVGIGIGLDIGEAAQVEGGYRGAALNRAARLCSLAAAGEVLVSTGVVYVAPQVDGVSFVPRGQEQLKGFAVPVPVLRAIPSAVIEAAPPESATEGE